jgi:hypothetical protein
MNTTRFHHIVGEKSVKNTHNYHVVDRNGRMILCGCMPGGIHRLVAWHFNTHGSRVSNFQDRSKYNIGLHGGIQVMLRSSRV